MRVFAVRSDRSLSPDDRALQDRKAPPRVNYNIAQAIREALALANLCRHLPPPRRRVRSPNILQSNRSLVPLCRRSTSRRCEGFSPRHLGLLPDSDDNSPFSILHVVSEFLVASMARGGGNKHA